MMRRLLAILASATLLYGCGPSGPVRSVDAPPPLLPDYAGVCVPRTIAPLNFAFEGPCTRLEVEIEGEAGVLRVRGREAVRIPERKWRRLLARGERLQVRVTASTQGEHRAYAPFDILLSDDEIDYGLCYRRIAPGYELYSTMGIYERELASFRERPLMENTRRPGSCLNCHSFAAGDPRRMQFHLRGAGGGTLLRLGEELALLDTKQADGLSCVYPYWHPQGRFIAYAMNDIRQTFHNTPDELLDVYDLRSRVAVYDTQRNRLISYPLLSDTARLETFPAFSPDGRWLYFCSAAATPDLRRVRYAICRVAFDPDNGDIGGTIETIWADSTASALFPRPSPDGRWLMFTRTGYGTFPIWHADSDLWMLDLQRGEAFPAAALNSDDTESYHAWSSSGNWVVFSSRRDDGLHTRLYLAHHDGQGSFSRPLRLPQRDARHDERLMQSYNIPEFIRGPLELPTREIVRAPRRKAESEKR